MSPALDRIDELIAAKRLLDHPFYVAWSKGDLSRAALQKYAEQYYHWVHAFPTWLSATHANTTDLPMRQAILENLIDEERGEDNHPELWLRFCDAVGLDRERVKNSALLPETGSALGQMRDACRTEPAVAGLSAIYAYESQQPEVMKVKREGLRDLYAVHAGHEYFVIHESLDVEHGASERRLMAAHAGGHEDAMAAAAASALDATYQLLNGIERVRTS